MKVIACPNCSEQVSNLATKCPHCGKLMTGTYDPKYEIKAPKSGLLSKLIWIVVALAIAGGAVYYFG